MNRPARIFALLALLALFYLLQVPVFAAQPMASNQIAISSFTGIYHLNRDPRGLSILTTEETIVVDFPASGLYGINRSLPKKFQNHPVEIKITNVKDAAGNPIPYKTKTDNQDNFVVTTGDPAISLYGSQTIKLSYQTSGVINLDKNSDQFLLNVNGRGWDVPIDKVSAILYIPSNLNSSLQKEPSCYTSYVSSASNCQVNVQKNSQSTVIQAKTGSLNAHQALVMKLDFKPASFTSNHTHIIRNIAFITAIAVLVLGLASILIKLT